MNISKNILLYIIAHKGNCSELNCANCGLWDLCTSKNNIGKTTASMREYVLNYCITMYDNEYGMDNIKEDIVELLV